MIRRSLGRWLFYAIGLSIVFVVNLAIFGSIGDQLIGLASAVVILAGLDLVEHASRTWGGRIAYGIVAVLAGANLAIGIASRSVWAIVFAAGTAAVVAGAGLLAYRSGRR